MNDSKKIVALKVLALFLNQPEKDISCMELTGGSEEGTIFKCTNQNADYVIKFFSNIQSDKNEIAWTQHASDLGVGPKFFHADPAGSYMITEFAKGTSLVPDTANFLLSLKILQQSLQACIIRLPHLRMRQIYLSGLIQNIKNCILQENSKICSKQNGKQLKRSKRNSRKSQYH